MKDGVPENLLKSIKDMLRNPLERRPDSEKRLLRLSVEIVGEDVKAESDLIKKAIESTGTAKVVKTEVQKLKEPESIGGANLVTVNTVSAELKLNAALSLLRSMFENSPYERDKYNLGKILEFVAALAYSITSARETKPVEGVLDVSDQSKVLYDFLEKECSKLIELKDPLQRTICLSSVLISVCSIGAALGTAIPLSSTEVLQYIHNRNVAIDWVKKGNP